MNKKEKFNELCFKLGHLYGNLNNKNLGVFLAQSILICSNDEILSKINKDLEQEINRTYKKINENNNCQII